MTFVKEVVFCFSFLVVSLSKPANAAEDHNSTDLAMSQILQVPFPYDFPDQNESGAKLFPMGQCHGLRLEEATIDQLQQWMSSQELTARELADCYFQRVLQTDGYIRLVPRHTFTTSSIFKFRQRIEYQFDWWMLMLSCEVRSRNSIQTTSGLPLNSMICAERVTFLDPFMVFLSS